MSGVVVPGQSEVGAVFQPGPNAFPQHLTGQTHNGARILCFGGLTKLEWMAGMIASGLGEQARAASVVDLAAELLAECDKRQAPPQHQEPA